MWASPGSRAVQRPTSLVWVLRWLTRSSSAVWWARQKEWKSSTTSWAGVGTGWPRHDHTES